MADFFQQFDLDLLNLEQTVVLPAFPYESCFQRVDQEFVMTHFAHGAAKRPKIHGIFLRHEKWLGPPGGAGSSPSTR
jgi:hypothetical protein